MRTRPFRRVGIVAGGLLGLSVILAACDDPFAEFLIDVPDEPSEALLFDFDSGRLQDPSAFDVIGSTVARPDQTTQWDVVFRILDGVGQLHTFSFVADSSTQAGLIRSDQAFEDILRAPDDGYETSGAQTVTEGDVFILRSRRDRTQFLICNQYAKLEILDMDMEARTLLFRFLRNPNCGDTVLQPGTHGSL